MRYALLICVLAIIPAGCEKKTSSGAGSAGTTPSTANADDWTHKELLAHLKKSGLDVGMWPGKGKSAYFVFYQKPGSREHYEGWDSAMVAQTMLFGDDIVLVELCESTQDAREKAGKLGDLGIAWNGFTFRADGSNKAAVPLLQKIEKALTR